MTDCTPEKGDLQSDPMESTILLVSPDLETREQAALLLERLGYRVLEARHAIEAQRLYDECGGAIDLLLTEAPMSRVNGHALADSLRSRDPGLRVLFLSDASYERMARRVAAQKRLPFLVRPFTQAQLAAKVREALDGQGPDLEVAS
jgi:two-component system, cell cycle sensor histidine kinase and response regulator CckA